jgi:hypothetical protein
VPPDYCGLAVDAAIRDADKPLADLTSEEIEALAARVYDYLIYWDVLRVVDGDLRGGHLLRLRHRADPFGSWTGKTAALVPRRNWNTESDKEMPT